jgi:hypothetical protein
LVSITLVTKSARWKFDPSYRADGTSAFHLDPSPLLPTTQGVFSSPQAVMTVLSSLLDKSDFGTNQKSENLDIAGRKMPEIGHAILNCGRRLSTIAARFASWKTMPYDTLR